MSWLRPQGPPRMWRDLKLPNSAGKNLHFIIQDIPEDRYDEVLEHMLTFFVKDEITLSSIKISEDPEALIVLKEFWSMMLNQGMSIAAFEKSDNDEKLKLAGLNILSVINEELENKIKSFPITNEKMKKFFNFLFSFNDEGDPRKIFNVDLYLSAFGLSVHPQYRKLGLGQHLLLIRDDIGRLYNIKISETIFTSAISQKIAAKAGFKDYVVRFYDDIVDEKGEKLFPLLMGKQIKIMMKQLL